MQFFIRMMVIALVILAGISQAKHMSEETIEQRTSRVGQVYIEGMPKAVEVAEAETATAITEARSGEFLYNNVCISCHSIGLANAPKMGDAVAWTKLLEIGIDNLVSSAKKGKNVMPPMGTCADCSDDELKNAILFMSGLDQ